LIAASAPRIIEAIETKTMICCHCGRSAAEGRTMTRTNSADARRSWAPTAKKAVTGVGAPS
jgi:hypothetical protein